ncbi:hypothetical protein CAG54_06445 [Vibrio sp. V27_P1S3P104]|uniref:hypothetical protein n=1 Tax=unclassified Vibrio TaxID=2614977 RepID=UPI001373163B|nr:MULTISPECIES: hypothetical protein [unclassified Vibrio]NAW70554.1 hypothetical protein [Vibrio sp. V28_P6S34P95]NAX05391.1 hypothetical protein [Vibrio sp. V30_P3S12P165]NAX34902.1 hypothetical protein [Vibrio sp. V29_P1S30P107]NAX37149.1 hypothetical protein [Vibrio sp. V27_P1S3P104]NAX39467.1 hypothetical protein [Vibrio sp. V26_P1S5P106]
MTTNLCRSAPNSVCWLVTYDEMTRLIGYSGFARQVRNMLSQLPQERREQTTAL